MVCGSLKFQASVLTKRVRQKEYYTGFSSLNLPLAMAMVLGGDADLDGG